MAGKVGRSGRRPLSVEVERSKIRDAAWRVTGEFINSDATLKDRADRAVKIVTADMAKPVVINNDNSSHTHLTTVDISRMSDCELIDFLTGRTNGISSKST